MFLSIIQNIQKFKKISAFTRLNDIINVVNSYPIGLFATKTNTVLCTYISQAEEQRRRHQIKQGRKTSAGGGENSKRSQAEIAERIGESKCAL